MKKWLSFLLVPCMMLGSLSVLPGALAAQTVYDKTLTYSDTNVQQGLIKDNATISKTTKDGMSVMKTVPKPTASEANAMVAYDTYAFDLSTGYNIQLAASTLKTISFYCYYEGSTSLSKAQIMVHAEGGVTTTVQTNSVDSISKGEWIWVTFDAETALAGKTNATGSLRHFTFRPYGTLKANQLTTSDIVYIAKVRLTSSSSSGQQEGEATKNYLFGFRPGRPDIIGSAPMADTYVDGGTTITIPTTVTYSRPNYTFSHYVSTFDTNEYAPGQTVTIPWTFPTNAGMAGATPHAFLIPVFTIDASPYDACLPIRTVNYSDWFTVGSSSSYVTTTKNAAFDGHTGLLKAVPKTTASTRLTLDSSFWNNLPLNLDYYKYATIEYYLNTSNNILSSYKPQLQLYTTGGALSTQQTVTAKETVCDGQWALLSFDLSGVSLNTTVAAGNHVLNRFQFLWQTTAGKVSDFASGTELYIGRVIFYHEKPAVTPQLVRGYMDGDTNGTFRPHDKLTKAEAAKLLYNLLKIHGNVTLPASPATTFTDVAPSDWYYTCVATLESLGIIPTSPTFSPNAPVTRKEFAIYVQNSIHAINGSQSFGTGIFGSGDTITREEAVAVINRLVFGELRWDVPDEMTNRRMTRFGDVDPSIWSYLDIAAAASARISCVQNGVETPLVLLTEANSDAEDTAAGDRKVAEIDALTDARIAAIRATANTVDPSSWTAGTVYYLSSSSGSTYSAGTSASSPRRISDLSAVNSKVGNAAIKAGDVLLFKRGDTFRGQLEAVAGVTYSAYGTGAKPVFIRNTETGIANSSKWQNVYNSNGKQIWQYSNASLPDVGAIVLMNGDDVTVAYKEVPNYVNSQWVVRTNTGTVFDYVTQLDRDLEFVSLATPGSNNVPTTGPLYLRCDAGNPGSVYANIEFNLYGSGIRAASNVTVDNICLKHFGTHGVASSASPTGLTVRNCEIGWGGGTISNYNANGVAARLGNGVEIYGGLKNYTVDNCYIYQIYDAGATHQVKSNDNYYAENACYTNNVIEYCVYNIEYFYGDSTASAKEHFMNGVTISGNILRKAGYGWGSQRPDDNKPSNIKGWAGLTMPNKAIGFTVTDNIIDRTYNVVNGNGKGDWAAQLGTGLVGCEPYLEGNTFIQVPGRLFLCYGPGSYGIDQRSAYEFPYDFTVPSVLERIGAPNNEYYFCSEGADETVATSGVYHGVAR